MSVVADTHALHWFLTGAAQLSARAREALEAAEADLASGIYVSVASRLDLHYLVAARRMDRAVASRLWSVVHDPDLNIHPLPITAEIVELSASRRWHRYETPGIASSSRRRGCSGFPWCRPTELSRASPE